MREIRKILLGGDIGRGEESLLLKLAKEISLPIFGVRTLMYDDRIDPETGGAKVYMYPAAVSPETYPDDENNYVGACTGKTRNINTDVFRNLGMQLLSDIPAEAVVVIDEIGFFEEDVPEYTNRIFDILKDDHPFLGVIKTRYEDPFLSSVRHFPTISYYQVTKENRGSLFAQLAPVVRSWKTENN
jgi:nucleoside-triphosphatase